MSAGVECAAPLIGWGHYAGAGLAPWEMLITKQTLSPKEKQELNKLWII